VSNKDTSFIVNGQRLQLPFLVYYVIDVSSVIGNGTLSDQMVVVATDCVFNDRREGGGLVGGLAMLLNGRDQLQGFGVHADTELPRSIGMIMCHWIWR
jgi:hypothetical protein